MGIIVFEKDACSKMQSHITIMFQESLKAANKPANDWISTEEAKQLLGVRSRSKMQELRDTNSIVYSKHGHRLIQYSKSSILAYLKKNIPSD